MPWRWYPKFNKVVRADGTVARYKSRCKKWLKSHKPYRPQKRGLEKKPLWSNRFGFLELYNRREQQELKCPSGYSIGQCFNVLSKLWHGYHRARIENEGIAKMEKYAKAIQEVQKDLGIKTTSFPHLRLYGDQFILNNKQGQRIVFEDHSAMKKKQDEYDRWAAKQAKKLQQKVLKPDKLKGETIQSFPDESFKEKYVDEETTYLIPDVLEPDEEAGEKKITMSDDIPFLKRWNSSPGSSNKD
jgi:hypothetical protein